MKKIYEVTITGTEPVIADSPKEALDIANSTKGEWPTLRGRHVEEASLEHIDEDVLPWGGDGESACHEIAKKTKIGGFYQLPDGFIEALKKVLDITRDSDFWRPGINGVLIKNTRSSLFVVATDGFRLTHITFPDVDNCPVFADGAIVRRGDLKTLIDDYQDAELYVKKDGDLIVFSGNKKRDFIAKPIDASHPDYNRLIQERHDPVSINKEKLLDALEWVSDAAFTCVHNNVQISIKKNAMVLRSSSLSSGEWIRKIPCAYDGRPVQSEFNCEYFIEALQTFYGGTVDIEISGQLKPAIFSCPDENVLHVLMPLNSGV